MTAVSAATHTQQIGNLVPEALVEIVKRLSVCLRHIVAKGGITSSDWVTQGLGIRRARARGQFLLDILVWCFGHEAKSSGPGYIVFPGNVGESSLLAQAVKMLRP